MIHFEGIESFELSIAELFPKLTDANWLALSVPDAMILETSHDEAEWNLKPKLTFVTGMLNTKLTVSERKPNDYAYFKINGSAGSSGSKIVATMAFQPTSTGTEIRWTGEITEIVGLLKMVPKPLIRTTAEKMIEDLWLSVRNRLLVNARQTV